MGMLSRYQKSGGFIQLVQLIETTGKAKQENFLGIIEKEDPRWAQAIKEKMLGMDKILKWPDAVLAEIAARLQVLTLATALHGLSPDDSARLLKTFSHSQRRNIEDLNKAKAGTPAEISSAFIKILQEVRSMITNGYIRMETFAPEMIIPEDFENKLGKNPPQKASGEVETLNFGEHTPEPGPATQAGGKPATAGSAAGGNGHANGHASGHANDGDVLTLRMKVNSLNTENTQLKSELKIMRDKLSQIRKIA